MAGILTTCFQSIPQPFCIPKGQALTPVRKLPLLMLLPLLGQVPATAAEQAVWRMQTDSLVHFSGSSEAISGIHIFAGSPQVRVDSQLKIQIYTFGMTETHSLSVSGLPQGLAFVPEDLAGHVAGSLETTDTYPMTAQVKDRNGTVVQSFPFSVTVLDPLQASIDVRSYIFDVGQPVSVQGVAANPMGSVLWEHNLSTPLPSGLAFDPETGLLSGTADIAQSWPTLHFTAVDQTDRSTAQSNDVSVFIRPLISLGSYTFPDNTIGSGNVSFDFKNLAAVDGASVMDLNWTVDPNYGTGLPPNTTLSPSGMLTGSPTTPGTFTFKVVADYLGGQGDQVFSWQVE